MSTLRAAPILLVAALGLAAVPATAEELSEVIARGNYLLTLNRLQLVPEQLGKLAPLAEELQQAIKTAETDRQTALDGAQQQLDSARKTLLAGQPLSKEQQAALDGVEKDLKTVDNKRYDSAVATLVKARAVLYPQQNAYINWTPPRAPSGNARESEEQRAQRDRDERAMIALAEQFLTRVRFNPPFTTGTENLANEFLDPLMGRNSPQYPAARRYMLKVIEQVRVMNEPQWQAQRHDVALDMVQTLNLEQPRTAAAPQDQPFVWEDVYDILADPAIPALLRQMQEVRQKAPAAY